MASHSPGSVVVVLFPPPSRHQSSPVKQHLPESLTKPVFHPHHQSSPVKHPSKSLTKPTVWHRGGSNDTDRWRVVAFLFVGSEMAGKYSFSEQWNSIVILAWAYGELSPVIVSQAVQWELCIGVRVCASLAQPEDGVRGKPHEFLLGWYLQQCTHLMMLLLGCSPKRLFPPCSTAQMSVGPVTRELVRLAPPGEEGGAGDFVIPKPRGGVEGGSSVPYTTRMWESGCMERQRCQVVDTVVSMFMRVVVRCEGMEMVVAALWEDVQDHVAGGLPGGRVSALLRDEGAGKKRKVAGVELEAQVEGVGGVD